MTCTFHLILSLFEITRYIMLTRPINVAKIGLHALECLEKMHGLGYIHRDVKPSNFILKSTNSSAWNSCVVKIVDFGLAKEHLKDGCVILSIALVLYNLITISPQLPQTLDTIFNFPLITFQSINYHKYVSHITL